MISNNEQAIATQEDKILASPIQTSPEQPRSIPQLIQAPVPNLPQGRHQVDRQLMSVQKKKDKPLMMKGFAIQLRGSLVKENEDLLWIE